ncbi:hypothetical protein B0H14DRAFT_3853935 [Mycena olivaceomarginata]|nr:hypothetical protein B0H14DRAFT_3853935 [Mycena olivaceomarginata]
MSVSTPASFSNLQGNTMNPLLIEDDDPAEFLGIPASESLASTTTQYHSALNSPIPCETSELSTELPGGDLISFSSGDLDHLSGIVTSSEPLALSASSLSAIASKPPNSPEFSSNRHGSQPLREPQLVSDAKESGKTTNVYINGLPAGFRDDQLHAIAAPFGEIVSVRCFTRNGPNSSSGYGFVLFKTIAAAEKCIVTLKRSDLHPSFSKVNKPPRIVCPNSPSFPARSSSSSLGSEQDSPLPRSPDLNFKAKMAQLEDKNSANVYIEGLPLSADKNTLMELVYPYVIQSTRFLRSKLPGSQTMIAFMRMATRAAAEDVILHLNGKTVRGWDGDENKVYLRIADTLDQRELRRSEATSREDEPGRLTIAQATLLNYRAKDLTSKGSAGKTSPPISLPNQRAEPRFPDPLAATVHKLLTGNPGVGPRIPLPPQVNQSIPDALPHPLAANIHNLLAGNMAQNFRPAPFPHDPLYAPYTCQAPLPPPSPMSIHPNVAALFGSLAAMQQQRGSPLAPGYPPPPLAGFPNHFNTNANVNRRPPVQSLKPNINIGQGGFSRVPSENFTMPVRGGNSMLNLNARPIAAALVNGNMNPRLAATPHAALPQFSSPPVTAQPRHTPSSHPHFHPHLNPVQSHTRLMAPLSFKPPSNSNTRPLISVDTTPSSRSTSFAATHLPAASIDIIKNMTNNGDLPPQPTFPPSHARASTAPVVPRQPYNNNGIDNILIPPMRRERLVTNANENMNTTTNTKSTTNTNSTMNTNVNAKQNQNPNLPTIRSPNTGYDVPQTTSRPAASTRVFLGPQNVVHLPLLRFA